MLKPQAKQKKIEERLTTVLCHLQAEGSASIDFIESLQDFYCRNGFLTSKQEVALDKFWEGIGR